MRVEMPLVPQSLVESPKSLEKKELTADNPSNPKQDNPAEESLSYFSSPLGLGGTYSVSSLKAAVDYHAKYLTVAESNVQAAQHAATIPREILDRLSRL